MYSSICAAEAKWKLVLDTRLTFSFEHTVWPFFSVVGVISIVQTHYSYSTWLTLVISHTHALFISCVPLTHICRIQSVERCHACDGACIFFFFSHHLEMWIYLSGIKKKKKKKKKKHPQLSKGLIGLTLSLNRWHHKRLRLNYSLAHLESCEVISLSSHANDIISLKPVEDRRRN